MNAPEWNAMTDCPELEDLAAFHERRLTEADRTRVLEHVAACGNCQDILVELDEYAHGQGQRAAADDGALIVRDAPEIVRAGAHAMTEKPAGKVVPGRFGPRAFVPTVAAAAIAVFAFLSTRPSGMEKLVAASVKVNERPIAGRLSADFPYRKHPNPRGGGEEVDPLVELEAAAYGVAANAKNSATDRHAAGVAFLFLSAERREDAVKALVDADAKRPHDPAILTDLAAAYYANGDYRSALDAADRALKIEQTPAALWNRALALEQVGPTQAAIAAWNKYLAVDPSSEWAKEVKETRLPLLQ